RKESLDEDYHENKNELENEIVNLQKEIELISTIDEVDNHEELKSLNEELTTAMEDLNQLENTVSTDEEIKELEDEAKKLREKIADSSKEKNKLLKEMHSIKMKQWTAKAKRVSENMDIPKEWRE